MDTVYCIHSRALRRCKIGFASNLANRLKQLTRAYGELEVVRCFPGGLRLEAALHHHFHRHRVAVSCMDERKTGDTEWFGEAVLDIILTLDPKEVLEAYNATRLYELRLPKADVDELRKRGMTIADAIKVALR